MEMMGSLVGLKRIANLSASRVAAVKGEWELNLEPFALGNLVGGICVVAGNALILAATLRSPALRANCNLLIAVLAAVDLISGRPPLPGSHWVKERVGSLEGTCFVQQAILVLTGNLVFSLRTCALIWSPLFFR